MDAVERSWKAATLAERVEHVRTRPRPAAGDRTTATGPSDDGSALMRWARACTFGDLEALGRRLSWDGLSVEVAEAALADDPPGDFPIASWVAGFSEIAAEARECASAIGTPQWDADLSPAARAVPFADVWMPVVHVARRRLERDAPASRQWLSPESFEALELHLLRELAGIGALAVLEDFQQHARQVEPGVSDAYTAYVRQVLTSGCAAVFDGFPVLARLMVLVADQWVSRTATLVRRLADDRAAIESTFGPVAWPVRLTPGLSDRHDGGARVAVVEFASGLRVVYKPRDVRLERTFSDWLGWLQSTLAPGDSAPSPFALRPPRVLDRGTHGWVEWIEQAPLDSSDAVRRYFRSAGALICAAHVLGGADLHSENLIASVDGPVLVDTEMLLQPSTRPSGLPSTGDGESASPFESCLASGLVSCLVFDERNEPFDVGGLQPAAARALTVPLRRWVALRTADIGFVPEDRIHPALSNDVVWSGELQRPEWFVDEVCEGFTAAYRALEANAAMLRADDGPLAAFAPCHVRILFRPSDRYAAMLYVTAAPRYQRRGVDRSLAIEALYRIFARDRERPLLWPLAAGERQALEALDIPRMTLEAGATQIETARGDVIAGAYAQSGVASARARIASLGEDDLARQVDQLRAALDGREPRPSAGPEQAPEVFVAAAELIGDIVLGRAHEGAGGSLVWASSGGRVDLYAGAAGHGIFFAALAALTRDDRWCDAARRVWRGLEARLRQARDRGLDRPGICSGLGSVVYAMALTGCLIEDASMRVRAAGLAETLASLAIDGAGGLDVEGGAAGALLALLAAHAAVPGDHVMSAAGRCADRLADAQIRSGPDRGGWRSADDGRTRAGFAHGAAGIAYALGRWADRAGDHVADVIREAWAFERRVFAEHEHRWPALRRDGSSIVMAAWCHGAPGIALARAGAPNDLIDAEVAEEIDEAMRQTLSAPPSALDHLCCGNLGRADVALTVGIRRGAAHWVDRATAAARAIAERALTQRRRGLRGRGFQQGAADPAFFQGLAGIGYQFLRTASPSRLPSVLAFDVPSGSGLMPEEAP